MYRFRTPAILNVKVNGEPFYLGGEISVEIGIEHRESVSVREGRMEITCEEVYGRKAWVEGGTGPGGFVMVNGVQTPVEHLTTFIRDTDLEGRATRMHNLDFTFPEGAPPTIDGLTAKVKWMLKVILDVRGAFDSVHEEEIVLFLPSPSETRDSLAPVQEIVSKSPYEQCELELSLTSTRARTGEQIERLLKIQMWDQVNASEVSVELQRLETAVDMREQYSADKMVLLERVSLDETMTYRLPFSLLVPETCLPTVLTRQGSSVKWRVKGVLVSQGILPRRWEVKQVIEVHSG